MVEPDLFDVENAALEAAKATHASDGASADDYRRVLGGLIAHYEKIMRESRRLIRRSDRAELEMNRLNRELHALAGQLEYRAIHDQLTGALNRGALIERASALLEQGDMILIMLDIDYFKQINDDFGHPAGDAVIQSVVKCLIEAVGATGVIGRVGGEEFSVALQNQSLESGVQIAQRMCDAIARQELAEPIDRRVTVSVGVSWNPVGTSFESAYGRADAALYEAKRTGKNRVKWELNRRK